MNGRVVYMGSPDFAVPGLAALCDAGVEVVGVVSQPDRPAGRGRKLRPPPVKAYAESRGLSVFQPRKMRDGTVQRWLAEREADVAIVAAYGRILPQAVLDTPRLGCVNLHASLLPRWRGASPIQRAIAARDPSTGVCLMQMDAGLDTGAVLARASIDISDADTASSLSERLSDLSAQLLIDSLPALLAGELTAVPQPDAGVTLAPLLTKGEGRVPWARAAVDVHAHIRAMTSWPGAWTTVDGQQERWKIFPAGMQLRDATGSPGTLLGFEDDGVIIATGEGSVLIRALQRPGRKRMAAAAALRGARDVTRFAS